MEAHVTLIELVITGGIPFGGVLAAWIHQRIAVATLKTEMKHLKERFDEEKLGANNTKTRIFDKLDDMASDISTIKTDVAAIKK